MQTPETKFFWQFDVDYWIKELNSTETGLNQAEANRRFEKSQTHVRRKPRFQKDLWLFINQFRSPLMLLLIGAVILSSFLGDNSDVFIILFIIFSTSILSFLQERNAGRIVEKLQSIISLQTTVFRAGKNDRVPSARVVAGDILLLKAGDILPGDCLIIEANELYVNEASLTGESFPVRKDVGILDKNTELAKRNNSLWEGTNIVSGTAKALVINTGSDTIFGNIIQNSTTTTETSFEKGIKDFGYF
jgi:Mg2+-importing ATPase